MEEGEGLVSRLNSGARGTFLRSTGGPKFRLKFEE